MLEEIYYVDKRVSVIMPVYNDTKYIREAIRSVSCQTYQFWELIVVDDGSQQDIKMVLTPLLQDHRIHLIRLERNQGVANARNAGIQQATGRYVAFLDSDDVWLPDKLERQLQFMRKTKAVMSYTSYRRFCHDIQDAGKPVPIVPDVTYDKLLRGNCIGCLTVMIDRSQCASLSMPMVHHEDYAAWLNLAKTGVRIYGMTDDLARYRVRGGSLSANKLKSLLWTWRVYRDSQQLTMLRSLIYMVHYVIRGIRARV